MASQLEPGDEVIVTDFDHESNIGPWLTLKERGVVIKTWSLDPETFEIDLAELDELLTPRTKLVCVTHCSNILGTINPIPEIARRVHARRRAALRRRGGLCAASRGRRRRRRARTITSSRSTRSTARISRSCGAATTKLLELDALYHYFYGKRQSPP